MGSYSDHIYQYLLYPTVNNGNFTLVYNDDKNEKTIDVIDVMGKVVYTQKTYSDKLDIKLTLSSGVYYVKTTSKNSIGVKRIIVE